jgi:hypothetical protein
MRRAYLALGCCLHAAIPRSCPTPHLPLPSSFPSAIINGNAQAYREAQSKHNMENRPMTCLFYVTPPTHPAWQPHAHHLRRKGPRRLLKALVNMSRACRKLGQSRQKGNIKGMPHTCPQGCHALPRPSLLKGWKMLAHG